MSIFTKKIFVINQGGGGGGGGSDSLLIKDTAFKFTIGASETNSNLSHIEKFNINVSQAETNAALLEALKLTLAGAGVNDVNGALSETKMFRYRCWSSSSSDNDASRTTPTNANGQNDSVVATIKTNNSTANLTNPVVLTSTTFNSPATGTYIAKRIRVYFDIPVRTTALDTIVLQYKLGAAAPVAIYTHAGAPAFDSILGTFTFDISSLTLAQIQTMSLIASYTANLVAVPETSIRLDAWAVELEQ